MSSEHGYFTKDNLDMYLKELAKEYRKLGGKAMPAEIILIGGAAILTNYGFRNMTTDIDAVIHAATSMKTAINHVGDKFNLPNGWLNADFMKTSSYSRKLDEVSVYYRTFSNVLQIRTVSAEYLIAMKLRSGRKYKNDLSDIIGILAEHEKAAAPITMEARSTRQSASSTAVGRIFRLTPKILLRTLSAQATLRKSTRLFVKMNCSPVICSSALKKPTLLW